MRIIPWLRDLVRGWQSIGHDVIGWVQSISNPLFDGFFHSVTLLGDEIGYLLLLPLVYWCIDARLGRRLGVLVFGGLAVNFSAKLIMGIPRPREGYVRVLVTPGSPSFPSGHAQGSMLMWGYLWVWWREYLGKWEIPLIIFLIGFSRIYLGAHFPQDILSGWLLGAALIWLFVACDKRFAPWFSVRNVALQIFLIFLVVIIYSGLHLLPIRRLIPYNYSVGALRGLLSVIGAFLGFAIGVVLERRYVRFSSAGSQKQRILRFLLGGVVVGIFYVGGKFAFSAGIPILRVARYALVGVAAGWLAPFLFVLFGLAEKEEAPSALPAV